ncbi:MAG: SoxR reducing system RseC family protein [Desulfobacterales bacterium]
MSQERIEFGEIVSAEGRTAQVRMKRSSQCASCSCSGLCNPFGKDWMMVAADNTLGATAGQKVRIIYRVEGEVKASLILYIVPVLALLFGALLGTAIDPFNNTDLSAVVAGLSFVAVSFLLIRKYAAWKYGRKRSYHPSISEVLR